MGLSSLHSCWQDLLQAGADVNSPSSRQCQALLKGLPQGQGLLPQSCHLLEDTRLSVWMWNVAAKYPKAKRRLWSICQYSLWVPSSRGRMVPLKNVLQFGSEGTVSSMGTRQFNPQSFHPGSAICKNALWLISSTDCANALWQSDKDYIKQGEKMKGIWEHRKKRSLPCTVTISWREIVFAIFTRN